ncbi:MAG: hypothetical protein ACREMQ_14635 [Longimicrobiales bacterium]
MFYDLLRDEGHDSLTASQIIAVITKSGKPDAIVQAKTFLTGFTRHQLVLPIGPFANSTSWLDACKLSLNGQEYGPSSPHAKTFFELLVKVAAIVDGEVGEKEYRPGTKSNRFDNVARKFVDDHTVANQRDAEVHAKKRLAESANVPASTSIVEGSVKKLDTEVGALNSKQVFAAVSEFVKVVASYMMGEDLIDGICYVSSFKVDGWIYSRGAKPGQLKNDPKKGYLAYCVVANDAKAEQLLAYHYQDVVTEIANVPRSKANKAWKLVTYDDFKKKCATSRLPVKSADWPVVYYAINA